MSKTGPILIVEDDTDDKELFEQIIRELHIPNKLIWYDNTDDAFAFLNSTQESLFVIFSDVNMPGQNGLQFKKTIDATPKLRKKSIPFIFYSTSAAQPDVNQAYTEMTVQGFFKKGTDFDKMKQNLKTIFDYWYNCIHPNTN
jgi:CheY-like chemotaxis protein